MTAISMDEFECDSCGASCGNGGVGQCLVVSDLDLDEGRVVNLHFCRDHLDGEKKVKGCATKLLAPKNLAHYLKDREMYRQPNLIPDVPTEPNVDSEEHAT